MSTQTTQTTDDTSETYADYCARVASYTFSDEEIARETARRASAETYDAACFASLDDTQQAQQSRYTLAVSREESRASEYAIAHAMSFLTFCVQRYDYDDDTLIAYAATEIDAYCDFKRLVLTDAASEYARIALARLRATDSEETSTETARDESALYAVIFDDADERAKMHAIHRTRDERNYVTSVDMSCCLANDLTFSAAIATAQQECANYARVCVISYAALNYTEDFAEINTDEDERAYFASVVARSSVVIARDTAQRARAYADAVRTSVSREDETKRINASADEDETYEEYDERAETEETSETSVLSVLAFDEAYASYIVVNNLMRVETARTLARAEEIARRISEDSHTAYIFVCVDDEEIENRIVAIYQNARLTRVQRAM